MHKSLGYWLSGWLDGEGCFHIYKDRGAGYRCKVTVNIRDDDHKTVGIISRVTNLGNFYFSPGRGNDNPQIVWNITSKGDCLILRDILDQYPLRAKKLRDYQIWSQALDESLKIKRRGRSPIKNDWSKMEALFYDLKNIRAYNENLSMPRSRDEGFAHYLGGLIDGEGCFSIDRINSGMRQGQRAYHYGCSFQLNLRRDDLSILEEIRDRLGLGKIVYRKATRTSNPYCSFYIMRKGEINDFRDYLLENKVKLLTKKIHDFSIWDEALDLWNIVPFGIHAKGYDYSPLISLRTKLIEDRKYHPPQDVESYNQLLDTIYPYMDQYTPLSRLSS